MLHGQPHRLECWPIDIASGQLALQAVAMALYVRCDSGVQRPNQIDGKTVGR
jgi:crotonobetainyl-CoA:carnitine CoA-transferase CaiB-like acyl-CoA transferase